jgi:PRC-barrel domain protein
MQLTTVKKQTSTAALPIDEIERVVAAGRIDGSAVYSRTGNVIGTVDCLMIDKVSGKIAYAVVAIDAAGGECSRRRALPWSVLTYDPLTGGYFVNLDRRILENGPTFGPDETVNWNSETWNRQLHEYYSVPHFWI